MLHTGASSALTSLVRSLRCVQATDRARERHERKASKPAALAEQQGLIDGPEAAQGGAGGGAYGLPDTGVAGSAAGALQVETAAPRVRPCRQLVSHQPIEWARGPRAAGATARVGFKSPGTFGFAPFRPLGQLSCKLFCPAKRAERLSGLSVSPPFSLSGPTLATAPAPRAWPPQVRVVGGRIVLDQDSLTLSAPRGEEVAGYTVVNEDTRLVNASTYSRGRLQYRRWGRKDTDVFYRGLTAFGTDFECIAKLFPGLDRRHVKNKYTRELRQSPDKASAGP